MRSTIMVGVCAAALWVGCGGGSNSSGSTTGGTTGTSAATTGSGGGGGAASTTGSGGGGGAASTTGSGGGGGAASTTGAGGGVGAPLGSSCTMDGDCEAGLICYNFNAKGLRCTKMCASAADCPAPSSGCNGMGYCKPD